MNSPAASGTRICKSCSTQLAADNDGELCRPCERTARLPDLSYDLPPSGRGEAPAAGNGSRRAAQAAVAELGVVPSDEGSRSGPHVAHARAGAERIGWRPVAGAAPGRMLIETCTRCPHSEVYELVAYGGGRAIRRTAPGGPRGPRVHQTVLTRTAAGDALWQESLAGAAR